MSFTAPIQVNPTDATDIAVADHSAPAPVQFNDTLFLFYKANGSDGIFYTTLQDEGSDWTTITNVAAPGMRVAPNTGPCPIVFKGTMYLFYNGVNDQGGGTGTWYSTFNDPTWNAVVSVQALIGPMGFEPGTYPVAVVFQEKLYLFWCGVGMDGIFYATYDGTWEGQYYVGPSTGRPKISAQTSPAVAVFNNTLYLFCNQDSQGTWYTCFTNGSWTPVSSIQAKIGPMGFLDGTSPVALATGSEDELIIFWVGIGKNGLWYTRFNGITWTTQKAMEQYGPQQLLPTSDAGAVATGVGMFQSKIFWVALDRSLWYNESLAFDLDNVNVAKALSSLNAGNAFVCYSQDSTMANYFQSRLTTYPVSVPPGSDGQNFVSSFVNWMFGWQLSPSDATYNLLFLSGLLSVAFVKGYRSKAIMGTTGIAFEFIPPG
ncbi:hypothetical protein DL766_010501 [Monosporascus sp. MC13-8B]|nr:hypothetical protein DL763_001014 [Monosporascus cannonballus]RYP02096.1 hypothetical protein DL766_010501 [Monosporascus sp. MC13-8B]